MNYYNEFDPRAAAWLRELMRRGLIPPGDVDERSIVEVRAADLVGYTQCHFFAGIGGWSYALQLAGWPANRPVWTGSCPCQPFSNAGKFYIQPCRDGKARRVGSRVRVLAAGIPGRVGILRGFGNAIVPEVAAVFIQSYLEARKIVDTMTTIK